MSCQVPGTALNTSGRQGLLNPESGKAGCEWQHTRTESQGQPLAGGRLASQWERTGPARSDASTSCHWAEDLSSVARPAIHPSEPEECWRQRQTTSLCLDSGFSIFLIALRGVWRLMCSPWVVVGSRSICRFPFATASESAYASVGPKSPRRAEQVATVLSVSHLVPRGLAVWVKRGVAFHRLGVALSVRWELWR